MRTGNMPVLVPPGLAAHRCGTPTGPRRVTRRTRGAHRGRPHGLRRNNSLTRPRFRVTTAAATDVGRRRSGNEDSYASWAAGADTAPHAADHLLVVCDGMGGSNAGEVASRMAADTVVREFVAAPPDDTGGALSHAVQVANQEIWEHSRSHQDLNGMGTTCTAVAVKGDQVLVAH